MPGRRTPGRNILLLSSAEATIAPVLPAETTAWTSPAAISPQHREIELSRFFLRASTGFSSIPIAWLACTIGAVVCLPFAGQLVTQAVATPLTATLQIIYLGVFPTALGFSTWAYALSRTTAGRMGATTYAVPVLAVAMSWAFLDVVPGWLTLLGGLLCLAGVAVSRTRGGRSSQQATAIPAPAMAGGQHLAPDATRASPGTR